MSTPLAQYGFLSWLRRGVSTRIERRDGEGGPAPRATITVHVGFNADAKSVDVPLQLLGSGELASFNLRSVARTWPRAEVADAESNYFPLIEFHEADLPWRATPASAATSGRLHPWIVLIVLRDQEADFRSATQSGALPSIVVKDTASLPDLGSSWAWAHVQVSNETGLTPARVRDLVNAGSPLVTSRLLCPRRLEPLTRYTAYLVPAFERGRLSGLRLPVPDAVDGLAPAWTAGAAGVTLPVFYQWRFHTAEEGDFEALVRRLVPRLLPPEVGIRPMDVSDPRGALAGVPANDTPLGLEGALKTTRTLTTPWPTTPTKTRFVDRLRALLNAPFALLQGANPTRAVAPPLYGRWHAAQETLEPGTRPVWFHELNQDPRLRVTSGLGTQVVQSKQRELMAGAWQQVEGIRAANEERRQAQAAREAALKLYDRHFKVAPDESIIALTTKLHAKVKGSPVTIRALLKASPIPLGVVDTAFRRVTRPAGPLIRRVARITAPISGRLLERLNSGEIRPGAPPPVPADLPTIGGLATAATPVQEENLPPWLKRRVIWIIVIAALVLLVLLVAGFGVLGLIGFAVVAGVMYALLPKAVRDAIQRAIAGAPPPPSPIGERAKEDLEAEKFTRDLIDAVPARSNFTLREAPPLGTTPTPAPSGSGASSTGIDNVAAREFRVAAGEFMADLGAPILDAPPLRMVKLAEMRAKLETSVDPRITIAKGIRDRTVFSTDLVWEPEDPLDEIMLYPKFPQPMYEALRDLGQDWLLPGLELIEANTVALVITNQRMIESYMVGLNHEMSRELLWNEFPTDQRGSYFRQFWNVAGVEPPNGDPDKLRDIREIHAWIKRLALGNHSARPPMPNGEERLVLLVRGDLFRRYPNTEVYALKALAHPSGKRSLGTERIDYEFYGKLLPDIAFFGFPLTPTRAVGAADATDASQDQGWFFVLQEQPAEPRFGLDVGGAFGGAIAQWNELSWTSLVANPAELQALTHINLDQQLPDVRALNTGTEPAWHADSGLGRTGAQAAHLAYITLQQPVRIAIHASDMLRGTR
jgi:hypothetical protein